MDWQQAAEYWEQKDRAGVCMERDALRQRIGDYLRAHRTCALATACGDLVRCTPIEYSWYDDRLWMLSEGGRKFAALRGNPRVCLAVFDPSPEFGALGGMQITGTAGLVEPWSEEYCALLRFRRIPEQALRGLDHPMYLLRVTPERIEFLNSAFRAEGYSVRQRLDF